MEKKYKMKNKILIVYTLGWQFIEIQDGEGKTLAIVRLTEKDKKYLRKELSK
jgi:hypothetical protein